MAKELKVGVRQRIQDAEVAPVIWPFKPEWFELVGPDGLEEWERAMRKHVGIEPDEKWRPGCATISGSGNSWGDTDQLADC